MEDHRPGWSASRTEASMNDDRHEPGVEQDERATEHYEAALELVAGVDDGTAAVVHSVLSLASRVEELVVYLARLG